ncbi:MAG: hypothetical protein RJQ00_06515 [Vicingaceae bacterium]
MEIKKLNSNSVGSHHESQALILTEKGEIFVTKDEETVEGFELIKFQTYDLEQLTSIVNNVLRGVQIKSSAVVHVESNTIAVSPVTNLYKVSSTNTSEELNTIIGGYESQTISIISANTELTVSSSNNLRLENDFIISNEYSIILLQKNGSQWIEISRNINQ